jgi:DNA mismatch endonuclease (patch repair protein)
MQDIYSSSKRSFVMSRIHSEGTEPEVRLYSLVRQILGPRARIRRNVRSLPGAPDIMIPSLRVAIFADGCFFHSCPRHGHVPKSRRAYWAPKLEKNADRDARNRRRLRSMGYAVWKVWEHDLLARRLGATEARLGKLVARRRWHLVAIAGPYRTCPKRGSANSSTSRRPGSSL